MSSLPHTLENLVKSEKDKVVCMLKDLKEARDKCQQLEKNLEEAQFEHQRLSGREEATSKQFEDTQAKLLQAVALSRDSQEKIDELHLKLQQAEKEKREATTALEMAEAESQLLREKINEIKMKHEQVHVDAYVMARIITCDRSMNTIQSALNLIHEAVQAPPDLPISSASPTRRSTLAGTSSQIYSITTPPTEMNSSYIAEADQEISELIAMLNPF